MKRSPRFDEIGLVLWFAGVDMPVRKHAVFKTPKAYCYRCSSAHAPGEPHMRPLKPRKVGTARYPVMSSDILRIDGSMVPDSSAQRPGSVQPRRRNGRVPSPPEGRVSG